MKKLFNVLITILIMNGLTAQWTPQNSGTTLNLNSVWFTSTREGCIVGDSGIILKTTDGGINWLPQNFGVN